MKAAATWKDTWLLPTGRKLTTGLPVTRQASGYDQSLVDM